MRIFLALLAMTVSAQADVIRNHRGGTGAMALEMARKAQVIDGPCKSACAWSFLANERACFTVNAEFQFHGFRDPGTDDPMPAATVYWLERIPAELRPVAERDWTGPDLILVTSLQMEVLLPERKCK